MWLSQFQVWSLYDSHFFCRPPAFRTWFLYGLKNPGTFHKCGDTKGSNGATNLTSDVRCYCHRQFTKAGQLHAHHKAFLKAIVLESPVVHILASMQPPGVLAISASTLPISHLLMSLRSLRFRRVCNSFVFISCTWSKGSQDRAKVRMWLLVLEPWHRQLQLVYWLKCERRLTMLEYPVLLLAWVLP